MDDNDFISRINCFSLRYEIKKLIENVEDEDILTIIKDFILEKLK